MADSPDKRPRTRTKTKTRSRPKVEPPWRVLLHNDDLNSMDHVVRSLQEVFELGYADANAIMQEAHCTGVALCAIEPRSFAARHRQCLQALGLVATMEPDLV
jgi:ATP-dependent Clp protease adaptor protein ClpS